MKKSILVIIVLLCLISIIYNHTIKQPQILVLNDGRYDSILNLYNKLNSQKTIIESDVLPFAEKVTTRENTFELLKAFNKTNIFPKQFYTIRMGAESNLVNWLQYPTELGNYPDSIMYLKRVTIDFDGNKNYVHYEVFKYKVNEPHWAAKEGWIIGVVGPYFDDSKPFDFPRGTFSIVTSAFGKVSIEDEVKWVHENVSMKQ